MADYHKSGNVWMWNGYLIKGADAATFTPLNRIWAKDAKRVYTYDRVNRQADVKTFKAFNHIYAKDANHAFYLSGVIKEADAKTFRVLDDGRCPSVALAKAVDEELRWEHQGFGCDATQVFHYVLTIGKPCVLTGADPKKFRVMEYVFGTDGQWVYREKSRLKKADPETFEVLNRLYSKDAKRVYYAEREMAEVDAGTFRVLGEYWAVDAKRAYFQDHETKADPATLKLVHDAFMRDARHVYQFGGAALAGADPATFENLCDSPYYKDKQGVYYSGYPSGWVTGADAKTFRVVKTGKSDAQDAGALYRSGKRIGKNPA